MGDAAPEQKHECQRPGEIELLLEPERPEMQEALADETPVDRADEVHDVAEPDSRSRQDHRQR
jgi:hypothetical protein